jgi:hypothetical protein
MNDRFEARMSDEKVRHDISLVADFVSVWCRDNHADRAKSAVTTPAALLGVYGRKAPELCDECSEHLAYAEKRRAYCPKDPKPFCAHCDTHCYSTPEREWQSQMMRYVGPKSWRHGHLTDSIRHALAAAAHKREQKKRLRAAEARPEGKEAS